jgi:hypothetical protein
MASYAPGDVQPTPGYDDAPDLPAPGAPVEPESPPDPWYRSRSLLVVWATMVAILVVLIIYGLIQLSHGNGGGSYTTPSTSTTGSSTPTGSSTTTPPSTTTTTTPSPSSEEQQPPNGNAPPPAQAPAEPPEHHHHLPHIPSTIPLPHTVITLPHGF